MRAALDTNVLVYAEGFGDQPRVERSRSLLQVLTKADLVIPLQCLGELYRVLTAKARREAAETREALVLSVAADAEARLLISEDFNPGFTWRGVRVVNPFADALDPVLVQLMETAHRL